MAPDPTQRNELALFDLDGTLSRRDTFLAFLIFCLLRRMRRWVRVMPLGIGVALHLSGFKTNTWLKVWFLRHILSGLSRPEVDRLAAAFVSRLMSNGLLREGLAAIRAERARGRHLVLATASPDLYVVPLARALGFDDVICTRVAWSEAGLMSGELADGNCYGPGKLEKVHAYLAARGSASIASVFTDHRSDLDLLALAAEPRLVNPDRRLAATASDRGIPVLRWT